MDRFISLFFWLVFIPCLILAAVPLSFVFFVATPFLVVTVAPVLLISLYMVDQRQRITRPIEAEPANRDSLYKGDSELFGDITKEFDEIRELIPMDLQFCSFVHLDTKGQFHLHSYFVDESESWTTQIVGLSIRDIFEKAQDHLRSLTSLHMQHRPQKGILMRFHNLDDGDDFEDIRYGDDGGTFEEDLLISVGS